MANIHAVGDEDDNAERLVGRITIRVLLSLFVSVLWMTPLFLLLGIGQSLGIAPPGKEAFPTIFTLALIGGFATVWYVFRRRSS